MALTAALALHVVDEAANDFLSVYNPTVEAIREQVPWFPMPTFGSFGVWLGLLIVGVVVLFALSPYAFRGSWGLKYVAYPYGVIMVSNGLGHITWSMYRGEWVAGVYSSPVLLAASVWLLVNVRRAERERVRARFTAE